eukprot:31082-Pelagococcus_subviridis.AAC.3
MNAIGFFSGCRRVRARARVSQRGRERRELSARTTTNDDTVSPTTRERSKPKSREDARDYSARAERSRARRVASSRQSHQASASALWFTFHRA